MNTDFKTLYDVKPIASADAVIQGKKYRISVLTDRLIRFEYNEQGVFIDRPTQRVINRFFETPKFKITETEDRIEITTDYIYVFYDKRYPTACGLYFKLSNTGSYYNEWHFGEQYWTYYGTARTLDGADGAIPLENGIIARAGFSILDDSQTMLLNDDGWAEPTDSHIDVYAFGYGIDVNSCMKAFYHLTGNPPLLPRFALGNWWSRYYPYTAETYLDLMERFNKEGIPFSVSVIDMDWHITNVDTVHDYGGWTGFSWNRDLFPEPEIFLKKLHQMGKKVSLNLHPADGIRYYDTAYSEAAQKCGIDPNSLERLKADVSDKEYMEAYFDCVLAELEKQGVDFWWIDWQQNGGSTKNGYDTLWMYNHYHYLQSTKDNKRGLTFSRYAGPGSHRYPIGFSGDAVITWKSLDFQPYFTATAANIGFGWWSHDIGGHMHGKRDDELQTRWLQFGVFSPIMRLHSSNNPFISKEPWNYPTDYCNTMKKFLRLRHKLIPYLYSMNYRAAYDCIPLVTPLYYHYPMYGNSLEYKNQYFFGSEMMVCPITSPADSVTGLGSVDAWIPQGVWIDFFTNRIYTGEKNIRLFRPITSIPVLVKAGGIIPMLPTADIERIDHNPKELEVEVFAGANGSFTLWEDNFSGVESLKTAQTRMLFEWGNNAIFTIEPVIQEDSVISFARSFRIKFRCIDSQCVYVTVGGKKVDFEKEMYGGCIIVHVSNVDPQDCVQITFEDCKFVSVVNKDESVLQAIHSFHTEYDPKIALWNMLSSDIKLIDKITNLDHFICDDNARKALLELLTAD